MEVTNSNTLISDLLDTADLEASLNPIVLEPGWLESLASNQSSAPEKREWENSTNPNCEWRKWGEIELLHRILSSDAQLVLPKSGGFRQLVLSELYSAPLAGYFDARKTLVALLKRIQWPGITREVVAFCKTCDVF